MTNGSERIPEHTKHLKVWAIEGSGPLIRIDHHNLPDLDALLLDVLAAEIRVDAIDLWEDDQTTAIPGDHIEPDIRYYRTNPCTCGDGHQFDLGYVQTDENLEPIGTAARGAFLAAYFG